MGRGQWGVVGISQKKKKAKTFLAAGAKQCENDAIERNFKFNIAEVHGQMQMEKGACLISNSSS